MHRNPSVTYNIFANFAGRLWTAGMALAFVPIYLRLLGAEAYGLVGFFVSLQMILSLLEMGLGTTATKEMARLSGPPDGNAFEHMRNLVRTLEIVYGCLGVLVVIIVYAGAGPLSAHWFNPDTLSREVIEDAIVIMGLVIAVRMPFSLYSGALNGLQHQVALNVIMVVFVAVKHLGAVAALLFVSKDITLFFLWNLFAELGQTAFAGYFLQTRLPVSPKKIRFELKQIKRIWRFAAGMTGVGITNVALSQADKLFVSKMFPLETFGYYSAMWTIAGGMFFFSYPIITAAFPRYAQLWGAHQKEQLRQFYHETSRLMGSIMFPIGICVLVFAKEILNIWLGATPELALDNVLRILVAATIINSLYNFNMNLQFAAGRTALVFYTNLSWLVCLPLAMACLTSAIGLGGAPAAWALYNLFGIIFVAHMAHKQLLHERIFMWYFNDAGIPIVVSGVIIAALFFTIPMPTGTIGKCLVIACCAATGTAASVITLKTVRSKVFQALYKWVG